jgi:hypothetical protein
MGSLPALVPHRSTSSLSSITDRSSVPASTQGLKAVLARACSATAPTLACWAAVVLARARCGRARTSARPQPRGGGWCCTLACPRSGGSSGRPARSPARRRLGRCFPVIRQQRGQGPRIRSYLLAATTYVPSSCGC